MKKCYVTHESTKSHESTPDLVSQILHLTGLQITTNNKYCVVSTPLVKHTVRLILDSPSLKTWI